MDLTKYEDIDQGAVATMRASGMDVQCLLFSKDVFRTLDEAKAWARDHGFEAKNTDATATNWAVAQGNISGFDALTLKEADLAEGVVAMVGKRTKRRFEAVFRFATIHRKDERKDEGPHRIEGFVSIEGEDRQGDDIDPGVFNIEQFMARPTVYYEHKPWKTEEGNEVPVGHPEDMSIGIAHAIPDDDSSWLVTTENGTPLGVIEKRLNPGVKDGTRGLWVKVHITVDKVWEMIERGDVNAFSWYGEAEREEDTGEWLSVDMMEISPVMIGAHPIAGFSIAKAIAISEGKAVPDIELLSKDEVGKPLPNFHVCHLKDGDYAGYFTSHASHEGKPYDIVWGQQNGNNEKVSIRYPKDGWTPETAQSHCRNNAGKFDPATGGEKGAEKTDEVEKAVIGYADLGKAPEDTAWDGPGEVREASIEALRLMCAWRDSEKTGVKGSYKLPHHKAAGGHVAVWAGVRAAMGALLGARGGVDIPASDKRGVFNHLASHYRQFGKEVPEFKAEKGVDIDVAAEDEVVSAELNLLGKFVEFLRGGKKDSLVKGGEEGMAEEKAKEAVEETATQTEKEEVKSADDRIAGLEKQFAELKAMLESLVSKAADSKAGDAEPESPEADKAETEESKSEEGAEEDGMQIAEAIEQLGKNDTALHEEIGEIREELKKTQKITGVSRQLRLEKSHKKDAEPGADWTEVLWREAEE